MTRFYLMLYRRPSTAMVTTHAYPIQELDQLVRWLLEIQPEIPRTVECMLFLRRGLPGVSGPGAPLMAPALADSDTQARRDRSTLPPTPSHVMMLLWGPPEPVPEMAFSLQANVYLGLYGVAQDAAGDHACREWATGHMRRLEPLSRGIQLADENLGLRPARFASDAHKRRLDELRSRFDPDGVFHGYMG